jgi:DNA mismatch endonuclease (patch repair protein)
MQAVKSKDTSPELCVRRLLRSQGYRYRIHLSNLPGSPDVVFPGRKKAIFVHGCFWHGHACHRGARKPKSNSEYWSSKIARNAERDTKHLASLKQAGWRSLVIWECEIRQLELLARRISRFLG